ncbi:hypothetical protein KHA80_18665 [Anaerobacillus sp. HL2]|nr:hypothetical protein KHA80_18665 [Anaerobacillus sp. HL2]
MIANTGYKLEELNQLTENPVKLVSFEDDYDDLLDLKAKVSNMKVTYTNKENEVREGLLSTETIMIDEEPCIISVITDITGQVQLEKEITRLDKLNLVGEMAAGIAHEVS